jgi:hypothetical protein
MKKTEEIRESLAKIDLDVLQFYLEETLPIFEFQKRVVENITPLDQQLKHDKAIFVLQALLVRLDSRNPF